MTRKILAICAALLLALTAVAEGFTAISAGGAHALAVDEKGNVWAWGSNVRGESVPGNVDARVTGLVKVLENAVSVACGRNFSLALTSDGALYGWGDNRSNQLPGVSDARADAPVLLREGVLSMDACEERAVLVTMAGEAFAWGAGENLHLLCDNAAEAAVGVDFTLVRLKTGEVYEYPDNTESTDAYEPASAEDSTSGDAGKPASAEDSANGDASEPESAEDFGDYGANEAAGENAEDERNLSGGNLVGVKKLEHATGIEACGQTRMALTEDGTLDIWGAAGADGRLGLATSGWVETPAPLELADVRTFSAGLTTSGAITESGEAYLWGTVYSYVMLYDENGDPAASVVDGPLVSYGSAPVRLYENAQALAFGDAFVLLLRADGTILAWGSNDHGQMADGDWTKAELADSDDEDEKDVVITEADQFVFPAVLTVPENS